MTDSVYGLRCLDRVSLHFDRSRPRRLRDIDEDCEPEIEAMAASDDCFVALATQINDAVGFLVSDPEDASPELQKIIRTLFYLQRNYRLVRRR